MSKVKMSILKKLLGLFIKEMDLTPEEDQALFNTLKIINAKNPLND
jgi:hypothetical protein